MCGITLLLNKLNKKNAVYYVLKSLEQLQNRGYDSFGLSFYYKNKYEINKICNKNYDEDIFEIFFNKNKNYLSNVAFGHSRWATHGKISNENAHPHVSNNKLFMCVHNGIIENYDELKKKLIKNGYDFYSETDTEVIINLIEYNYYQSKNVKEAIELSIKELKGTYGLIICDMTREGVFYIIRNGSPLLLGISEEFLMITSENRGFLNLIKSYYNIKNDELVIIENNKIKSKLTLEKEYICDNNDIILGDYDHYTIKEINEQSNTLLMAINNGGRIVDNKIKLGGIEFLLSYLNEIKNIVFLGCGTSLYACEIGAYYIKNLNMNVNTFVYDGGEFCENDIPKNGRCLFIFVSQSGETMDLIQKIDLVKLKGHLTMGIINTVDSSIAKNVDCGVYLNAGKEIAVASTKSFSSMLLILSLISMWFTNNDYNNVYKLDSLRFLSNTITNLLYDMKFIDKIDTLKEYIIQNNINSIFILGKHKLYPIACEGALKIKEVTYIHCEGFSAGSLKHGPFALLDNSNLSLLLIDYNDAINYPNIKSTYYEILARETNIFVITNSQNVIDELKILDNKYLLLYKLDYYNEIIFTIVLQKLAYEISIAKNINPDKPRNLAKVVTVE